MLSAGGASAGGGLGAGLGGSDCGPCDSPSPRPEQSSPSAAGRTWTQWPAWAGSGEASCISAGGAEGSWRGGRFVTACGSPAPSCTWAAHRQWSCTGALGAGLGQALRRRGLGGAGRLAGPAPVLCPGLVCKEAGAQGGGGLWGHDRRLDPGPLCLVTAAHGLCRVSASSSEKWVKAAQAVGGQGGDEWAS